MVDLFENYDTLREFSPTPEEDLIDFQIVNVFVFTTLFLGFYLATPSISYAAQSILQNSPHESFFEVGNQKINKLYKEYDYRPVKKQLKKIFKTKIENNIVDTSLKNVVEISLPVIDLTPLFYKNKIVEITISTNRNPLFLVQKLQKLVTAENSLLLRGGFLGYGVGKLAEKIGKKALDWVDRKTDSNSTEKESIFSSKKKLSNQLVVEKQSFKTILLNAISKIISPKQPYIYIISGGVLVIMYKSTFRKLFNRQITPAEVVGIILKDFLKTNLDLYSQLVDKKIATTINNIFKPSNEVYYEHGIFDIT